MEVKEELYYVLGLRFCLDIDRDMKLIKIKAVFDCNDEGAKVILNNSETHGDIVATKDQLKKMTGFGITYTSVYTQNEIDEQQVEEEKREIEESIYKIKKEFAKEWFDNLSTQDKEHATIYFENFTYTPPQG
jgi:hypothetical protein